MCSITLCKMSIIIFISLMRKWRLQSAHCLPKAPQLVPFRDLSHKTHLPGAPWHFTGKPYSSSWVHSFRRSKRISLIPSLLSLLLPLTVVPLLPWLTYPHAPHPSRQSWCPGLTSRSTFTYVRSTVHGKVQRLPKGQSTLHPISSIKNQGHPCHWWPLLLSASLLVGIKLCLDKMEGHVPELHLCSKPAPWSCVMGGACSFPLLFLKPSINSLWWL